jgi:predicted DNA-binding ribbon-helix-helix protein
VKKKQLLPGPKVNSEGDRAKVRSVSLSDKDWAKLQALAKFHGVTISALLRSVIREAHGNSQQSKGNK